MKIIAVGRNYRDHARELNNPVPEQPVIFLKPDTAILKNNRDFYLPSFSSDIHYEAEIIVQICKEGKHVAKKFASNYYDKIGLGIDFTARDLQSELKAGGLPWELAKSFDHSAPVSELIAKEDFLDLAQLSFTLEKNGQVVQSGTTRDMIFSIEELICFVSRYITLRKGDLIFTGTPAGVGRVDIGDQLSGYIEGTKVMEFQIK